MKNLDFWAAEASMNLIGKVAGGIGQASQGSSKSEVKEYQKLYVSVGKCMGILLENGVYALFVYLLAKKTDYSEIIYKELYAALKTLQQNLKNEHNMEDDEACQHNAGARKPVGQQELLFDAEDCLNWLQKEVMELPRLLLVREYLQQILVYTRYSAAAKKKEAESNRKKTAVPAGGGELD
jgi:hypothetical protein